jgi:hypothetical protein
MCRAYQKKLVIFIAKIRQRKRKSVVKRITLVRAGLK